MRKISMLENTSLGDKNSEEKSPGAEQRRFRRYGVNFPCVVKPRGGRNAATSPEVSAQTQDVSSGGLYLSASADWTIGTEVECELRLPIQAFGGPPIGLKCRGKVVRVDQQVAKGRVGVGIKFDHYEFFHLSLPNENS